MAGETYERLLLANNEAITAGDGKKAVESFEAALHPVTRLLAVW